MERSSFCCLRYNRIPVCLNTFFYGVYLLEPFQNSLSDFLACDSPEKGIASLLTIRKPRERKWILSLLRI